MRENLRVSSTPELYDKYTSVAVDGYDRLMLTRLISESRRLGLSSGRIVDACTGTGQLLLKIARAPEFAAMEFIAFDFYSDMVECARQNVDALGLGERIRVEVADVHALPYLEGFAHLVMARSVIHHWSEPVRAFREIERILAPGGVAIIHEPRRDPDPKVYAEDVALRRRVGLAPSHLDEKYTADEVRAQLVEAGIAKFDVFAEARGPEAIGFEVRIEKPTA